MEIGQPLPVITPSVQPIQQAIAPAIIGSPVTPPSDASLESVLLDASTALLPQKQHVSAANAFSFNVTPAFRDAQKAAKELSQLAQQGNTWQSLTQSPQAKTLTEQMSKLDKGELHRISCQMPEVFSQFTQHVKGEKEQALLTGVYEGLGRTITGISPDTAQSLRQATFQRLQQVGMTTTQAEGAEGSPYRSGVTIPQGLGWKAEMDSEAMTKGVIKNLTDSVKCNPMKFLEKYHDLTTDFAGLLMKNSTTAKEFLNACQNLSPDLAKQVISGLMAKLPDASAALTAKLSDANPEFMKSLGFNTNANSQANTQIADHEDKSKLPQPAPVQPPTPPQPESKPAEKPIDLENIIPKPQKYDEEALLIINTIENAKSKDGKDLSPQRKIYHWIMTFLDTSAQSKLEMTYRPNSARPCAISGSIQLILPLMTRSIWLSSRWRAQTRSPLSTMLKNRW